MKTLLPNFPLFYPLRAFTCQQSEYKNMGIQKRRPPIGGPAQINSIYKNNIKTGITTAN